MTRTNKKKTSEDVTWKHCNKVKLNNEKYLQCNYNKKIQ